MAFGCRRNADFGNQRSRNISELSSAQAQQARRENSLWHQLSIRYNILRRAGVAESAREGSIPSARTIIYLISDVWSCPLLNRLQLFRNVGQFDSVTTAAAIALARLTLGYAENGRGKTTLSAILRSLATGDPLPIVERHRLAAPNPPHVVIECTGGPPPAIFQNGAWNRTVSDIVVFDDTFVDANVCSGLVVESGHRQRLHELILGSQGVAFNRALQQLVAQIEEHNRLLRTRADAIPANVLGGLSVDDFCALPTRADIDEAIREAERTLAAAKEQDSIRTTQEFDPVSLPPIDVAALRLLLARDLPELDRAAAEHVQNHITTLGEGGEAWVASGMERIPGVAEPDGKPCPFCAQDLGGSELIEHFRSYFGDAYAALKREVAHALAVFGGQHEGDARAAFERSIGRQAERRQFWSRFADVPAVELDTAAIARTWASAQNVVVASLDAKRNAPLEPIGLSEAAGAALDEYERAQTQVLAVSNRLQQANGAIRLVKEQAAAGNTAVLEADVARLKAAKSRHTPAVAPLCDEYLAEKARKATAEQQRDTARAALERYRQTVFPTYQEAINDYLRKFNAGFRLDRITSQNIRGGSACTYNVLINNQPIPVSGTASAPGEPSFRSSLSAGDRNTLALAFFFASLDQDVNLANKIIVIDDPISSLDEHRSLTTVQEVRRLMQRTLQVLVLSHNKPFLCNIWDGTDTTLRGAIEFVRAGDGSTIRAWDVNRDMITEHDRRHALLRDYTVAATPNDRDVASSLRPVIESFIRVAYRRRRAPISQLTNVHGPPLAVPYRFFRLLSASLGQLGPTARRVGLA
jgi:wobble nucleotide-excising tRNase